MKKIVVTFMMIMIVVIVAAGCAKSVGPNRKSDALKRAKEYAEKKYGHELKDAKITRCSNTGETLTYNSVYIVTEEDNENAYNIVVDYDENGKFIDIGDDKQSDAIREDFFEWASIGFVEPSAYIFGGQVPGGGESANTEPIYYFDKAYNGDIEAYIKEYEGEIYLSYDIDNELFNKRLVAKLGEVKEGCKADFEINTSVSKTYNMGLSVAVPSESICSIQLKNGVVTVVQLERSSVKLTGDVIASTYIDKAYKNMIDKAQEIYKSQISFLQNDASVILKKGNIYKDENGNNMTGAYTVQGEFSGRIEIAFSRKKYSENDVKVYEEEGKLLTPGKSNDRFYYDDNYFYYLVEPGYIIKY